MVTRSPHGPMAMFPCGVKSRLRRLTAKSLRAKSITAEDPNYMPKVLTDEVRNTE